MNSILVLTDFSKCANNAMLYALAIAKQANAHVHVIHNINPSEELNNDVFNMFFESNQSIKENKLKKWSNRYKNHILYKDITITSNCVVGYLPNSISEYLKMKPADLIVMGTMGDSGITSLLGSNASKVIAQVKIPTFVVPIKAKYKENAKICILADFETKLNAKNNKLLTELLIAHKTTSFNVLHFFNENEITNDNIINKLKKDIGDFDFKLQYAQSKNIARSANNFLETSEIDILCAITHHHNFLYQLFIKKSVTKSVVLKAKKAILVLHES